MAYLQLSLLHIPAIIQHGNTLTMEEFGRWHTPSHIMGGWTWRTRRSPANALLEPSRAADAEPAPLDDTNVADIPQTPAEPSADTQPKPTPAEKVLKRRTDKPTQLTLF